MQKEKQFKKKKHYLKLKETDSLLENLIKTEHTLSWLTLI